MCVTGNSWTIVFNDGAEVSLGRLVTIDGLSEGTAEAINDSDLSTTLFERYCTPDLADQEPLTATYVMDPLLAMPVVNTSGTLTITCQKVDDAETAANYAGNAMISSSGLQEISNNVRVLRDVGFRWLNDAAPMTFTPETTTP